MNESETRAELIDPALQAAGWGVVEGSRIRREYTITLGRIHGHGTRGKALTADYVLEYRNTKLAIRHTYSTNGHGIYAIDMETGYEQEIAAYPSPEELWNKTFAKVNAWRDRFATVPFEDKGGYFQGRYYQDIAIERVLEAVATGKQRIL
ncbi:MAG: restriction endonuclease subunit R, partial [Planctomycetota bacterium]|nr:restriction endonuclease subunit R [Planctomycetota bacterium]